MSEKQKVEGRNGRGRGSNCKRKELSRRDEEEGSKGEARA